jgi:parvulin-like peptidyl-prolyl isomerase
VKTDRGVHLILIESREPASETPFETVSEQLATELLRDDKASEAARAAATALLAKLAAGEPFVAAADALKLPVAITPPFGIADPTVPGLAGVAELKEVAFSLSPAAPSPQRVFADTENLYVVSLLSRQEPDSAQVGVETGPTRDRLLERERALTASLWYQERLKQLESAGKVQQLELATR